MAYAISFSYPENGPSFRFEGDAAAWAGAGAFGWGIPLSEDFHPPTVAVEIERLPLTDIFPFEGTFAVSARFRDIIEMHEPGVHQFYPLTLKRNPWNPLRFILGRRYKMQYYLFNVCQRFDAIFTTEEKRKVKRPRKELLIDPDTHPERDRPEITPKYKDFAFSKPKIAGRHVWQGNIVGRAETFVSDEVGMALLEAQMEHFSWHYHPEVDKEWDAQANVGPVLDWLRDNPDLPPDIQALHQEI